MLSYILFIVIECDISEKENGIICAFYVFS